MRNRSIWPPLWGWMLLTAAAIALISYVSPAEQVLGANARIVYLHGAWVWAALAFFILAGLAGVAGLLMRSPAFHAWSQALGRTGLLFWITYLPISMWAMATSWNGLFLAEPRFRLAVIFSITGLLLQLGLTLLDNPAWTSVGNLAYILILLVFLFNTPNVMHPPSPMLDSNAPRIQASFALLVGLTLLLAGLVAVWWRQREVL